MAKPKHCLNPSIELPTRITLAAAVVLLTGCANSPEPPQVDPRYSNAFPSVTMPGPSTGSPNANLQCVPYARLISGINLHGDAYTWWSGAEGIYQRGNVPAPGAVLVLRQTNRLRSGHVAVVRAVVDRRQILVDHANWLSGEVTSAQSVFDVSPANDWTMPRFYNEQAGTYGSVYPAYGFIYNAAADSMPLASGPDWLAPQ